ncbi:hypothetical protein VNI00_011582 [Paramarasmius palmivorus]|uniref:Fungal-type protein kinase domain-containing protein n=1 Tax=Paramarasmius palmivorus TaxID=297713 RepID=A0AAW0CC92_9AGAR
MNFVDEAPAGYDDHVVLNLASRHIPKRPREESNDDRAEEHGFKRAKFDFEGLWSVEARQLANDALSYLLFDTDSPMPSMHDLQASRSLDLPPISKSSWRFESRTSERMFIQAAKNYDANHSKQYRGVGEGPFARGFEAPTRVVLSDKLLPITALADPIQLVHAFKDTIKCHEWLVRIPKLIHGDISLNNLAYQHDEDGNTYGVLIDIDKHDPPTSTHFTGTKAFLSVDLLDLFVPRPLPAAHHDKHYARYDLESFLYVFAWIIGRYEHGRQIANPPYNMWVRGTMELAEGSKWVLLIRPLSRKVTPSYRELIHVLDKLCKRFSCGFQAFDEADVAPRLDIEIMRGSDGQPFDCATLGGHVTYANLLAVFDSFLDDQNDPSSTG